MTPASKVEVRLTEEQRAALEQLVHTGTHPAHTTRPLDPPRPGAVMRMKLPARSYTVVQAAAQ